MYLARPVRRGDSRLATVLIDRSRTIAGDALVRLKPSERTVGAEILSSRFVERFSSAVAAADWTILLAWVDASCARYAGVLPLATLLGATYEAVAEIVSSTPGNGLVAAEIDLVRAEIERLAGRPRLVREPTMHEAIDEVDVQLDDLMTRLDQSDALTAEHSRAVSAWCARLARRLSLSKHEAMTVTRSGLIHDIGKITTPPEILNAPRKLDEEEMAVMRRHAEEGARIVSAAPLVRHMTPAVRNHHERIDGRGYPDGLAGSAIPNTARIVAVADAFNAMIGRRPYRPPFAPSVALERLIESRGTQFDPAVVDAMVDVVANRT